MTKQATKGQGDGAPGAVVDLPSKTTHAQGEGGRKRLTGEERRAQIIEAAITLFGRHGFSGTTTKALAEASGVSEATIFKHFPTKFDLHAAAFERRTSVGFGQLMSDLEAYAERGDDQKLIETIVRAMLAGYQQDRDLHRMLMFAWLEQDTVENKKMWSRIQQAPLFGFLERHVARRQAEGAYFPGASAIMSAALVWLPVQCAIHTKLYGLEMDLDDEKVVETLARILLDGVRGDQTIGR